MKHNCPNCGAPIEEIKCPYCGTILYDFAALDVNHPTYVRIKVGEDVLTFKARLAFASISMNSCDSCGKTMFIDGEPYLTIRDCEIHASLDLDIIPDKNGVRFVEHRKDSGLK